MSKLTPPTSWNNVSVRQFNELKEFINDNTNVKNIYNNINILSVLCDIDILDPIWGTIYLSDLEKLFNQIKFFNQLPSIEVNHKIGNYILKDLNNLTLGEFIDLNRFLEDDIGNLSKICGVLYRNYTYDQYNNIIIEKYENIDLDKRSKYFDEVSINQVFGIINYFNNYKNIISSNYSNIFEPDYSDEEIEDEFMIETELKKEEMKSKFSWELLLYGMANGDLTKYDAILEMNFIFVLNQLSLRKVFKLD